ncbi:rod shape-determining protein MreC [Helicobacter anatolicus]|uniref:rod shape-determining protein MreC n=1 Tax=Helicobacter anatolicus TaxID=2905874 RepID=UPI001E61E72B|nr:rod shape-determining protein MreC [Helicobacter anatolicus]MCE3040112.1 rod shape-determining protein MreC [Helicobacter anatolicus]
MRYKFLVFLLVCLSVFAIFFESNTKAKKAIFLLTDNIKSSYHHLLSLSKDSYDKFFTQAKMIGIYKEKYQEYQKLALELQDTKDKLDRVLKFYPQLNLFDKHIFSPVMAMSYVELSQYNRVWLNSNFKKYSSDSIFGLVRDGYALGIAVVENERLLGLFNGDEKCSYSVYIGENKTPALIHFDPDDKDRLLADFIPQYYQIAVGDEVVTSGLDGIFIENISVGKVEKIIDSSGYVTAKIVPYAKKKAPTYLWIIDRTQDEDATK